MRLYNCLMLILLDRSTDLLANSDTLCNIHLGYMLGYLFYGLTTERTFLMAAGLILAIFYTVEWTFSSENVECLLNRKASTCSCTDHMWSLNKELCKSSYNQVQLFFPLFFSDHSSACCWLYDDFIDENICIISVLYPGCREHLLDNLRLDNLASLNIGSCKWCVHAISIFLGKR